MELQNKTILFLGSSVTYGSAAKGTSFVDLIRDTCGANCIKEAVSGTTLADVNERSYVSRLRARGATAKPDLFVCQLSTNDATKHIAFHEIEAAIRSICEYAAQNLRCPTVFYTGTYFKSEAYEAMIKLLYELKEEYGFYILDLFYDKEMRAIGAEDYQRYMRDPIHPTLDGYTEWWTPKFISFFRQLP
jgi:lysophospholipase L1-like esterase